MKQEEKKPISWEVKDPKPPVIHSGRLEDRAQHRTGTDSQLSG